MKKGMAPLSILILLLLSTGTAWSVTLSLFPGSQTTMIGSTASVDIIISGLGEGVPDSLGVFDLDLMYDPTILSFSSAAFGDPILGDQLDLLLLGSMVMETPSVGNINLFELSFDDPDVLDTLQAGEFTLATVQFDAIGIGDSPLELFVNSLGDSFGEPLATDPAEPGNISVSEVPEPGTILLLGTGFGLIGMLALRRKRA